MCNEFGETIAIIETSEGGVLPLEQALEIYHTALENGLAVDTVAVERLQLLWGRVESILVIKPGLNKEKLTTVRLNIESSNDLLEPDIYELDNEFSKQTKVCRVSRC